jgi:hypothetical protein
MSDLTVWQRRWSKAVDDLAAANDELLQLRAELVGARK